MGKRLRVALAVLVVLGAFVLPIVYRRYGERFIGSYNVVANLAPYVIAAGFALVLAARRIAHHRRNDHVSGPNV